MSIPEILDITSLQRCYRDDVFSPSDVAREVLARIARYADQAVWISRVPDEQVLTDAAVLEKRGARNLPLYGIFFAVKDNIDCAGMPTTAACPAFAYTPKEDATVVAKLRAAGAILIGKTNLDQFATGLVGTRSPYGAPRSVFNADYISGGSSSGSAVAVAAGLVGFALGTDTAGSGRVPASFNNIVGLKPSKGWLSAKGVVPACRTQDCVSIFAATAGDAMAIADIAAGFDAGDPYARRAGRRRLPTQEFRFGILAPKDREFFGDVEAATLYEEAIERASKLGGTPVVIDFTPFREAGALLYNGPFVAERYTVVGDLLKRAPDALDPVVASIVAKAERWSAADNFAALYRLAALAREAEAVWARIDVLLLPTAPTSYTVDEIAADPVGLNARLGLYTNFVNLLDCCAIAVPAGFRGNGPPFGVSLIAPAFADASLAALADWLHRVSYSGMGIARGQSLPSTAYAPPAEECVSLFVVGAHLSGMPLNRELVACGARFARAIRTAPSYRFFVLANTMPPKPGLLRSEDGNGLAISGEVWSLSPEEFGRFVARIPAPLGIGKVELEDGTRVSGFLCEASAVAGAREITQLGSWRRYIESLN